MTSPTINDAMRNAFYEATMIKRNGTIAGLDEGLLAVLALQPLVEENRKLREALTKIAAVTLSGEVFVKDQARICTAIARAALQPQDQGGGR